MLNPNSPVPLYRQLADTLQRKIREGQYKPGDRIPSEHELVSIYGIGRPTIRQALELLVRKRFLTKKRGAGTFVRNPGEEVDLFSLGGTISSFHRKGLSVRTKIPERVRLITVNEDPENPFAGKKAFFFSRLSIVEKNPVLIEDIYLDPNLFPDIDEIGLKNRSLSEIAQDRYYLRPYSGKQNFRIGYINGRKGLLLKVNSTTPVLLVKRFIHFPQAENGVFSELFCRTEQFVFSQKIGGNTDA